MPFNLPEHQTSRLTLKLFNPGISIPLFAAYPKEELSALLGCRNEEEYEMMRERFAVFATHTRRVSMCSWLIYERQAGELIGDCCYHIHFLRHRRAEIGYNLYQEKDRGKGYLKELLPYVLKYGIETLELQRIEALTATDNYPSMSLLRRFGFRREGLARKHYRVAGANEDSFLFSLIPEHFEEEPVLSPAEKLVRGFERQTLPASHWTHEAHLTVGLWHVYHYGADRALCRLRPGVIQFNSGVGGANDEKGGYHETLTVFWCLALQAVIAGEPAAAFDELLPKLLGSELASAAYPEQYYSRSVLRSLSARARYVAPDKAPLPAVLPL
ncbi:GNAT family N-acetyltransferase [Phaeodactylibacter luteus]|uniref:GNAT family N-acetyltransferase n=1 Tax=Phaeodactylibacter luteus TaxID=1564516 RepID=A0A5C6RR98_9BACT|nr:GNAT family protein [Phaeodactylibacter luteus]TXB64926.1 GNAT family N-acetyltransferase [Phaeodactylibacter luteus]